MEHFTLNDNLNAIELCINKALTAIAEFININYSDFVYPPITAPEDVSSGLNRRESNFIKILIRETSKLNDHYKDALSMATTKAQTESNLEDLVECPACKEKLLKCNYKDTNYCIVTFAHLMNLEKKLPKCI